MDDREKRLRVVVEQYRHVPFQWGVNDCALFSARCWDAQLGTSFESKILSLGYDSAISAIRVIQKHGGWEKILADFLLRPPVLKCDLKFGDLVLGHGQNPNTLVRDERTIALGICDDDFFMVPCPVGLYWLPMEYALKGWPCQMP